MQIARLVQFGEGKVLKHSRFPSSFFERVNQYYSMTGKLKNSQIIDLIFSMQCRL